MRRILPRWRRAGALVVAAAFALHVAGLAYACGHGAFAAGVPHPVAAAAHGPDAPPADDCERSCAEVRAMCDKPDGAYLVDAGDGAFASARELAPLPVRAATVAAGRYAPRAPTGPPRFLRLLRLAL